MKKLLGFIFLIIILINCPIDQVAKADLFGDISSQVTHAVNSTKNQQQNSQTTQQQEPQQAVDQQQPKDQTQQVADQQPANDQPSDQTTNPNRPPFKCKFSDFSWGDSLISTKAKLMSKGKQIKESDAMTIVDVGEIKGKFVTFDDVLFEMPCTITLGFSLKTEKLAIIDIQLPPNSSVDNMSDALTKKYGEPDQKTDNGREWGGIIKDEDTLSLAVNFVANGNGYLLEYQSGQFFPLLKSESDEITNAQANQDASKL